MGWWRLKEEKLVWGDGPADIMGEALEKIFKEYHEEWDRSPTEFELKEGLMFGARPLLKSKKDD